MQKVKNTFKERKEGKLLRAIQRIEGEMQVLMDRRGDAESALKSVNSEISTLGALLLERKELLRKRVCEASVFPLLALPDVAIMRVLSFVGPRELGRLARTCKQLERMTRETSSLWEKHLKSKSTSTSLSNSTTITVINNPISFVTPTNTPIPAAVASNLAGNLSWSCATPRDLCRLEDCPYPRGSIKRQQQQQQQHSQQNINSIPTLKVCIVGQSGVGKTFLLKAFESSQNSTATSTTNSTTTTETNNSWGSVGISFKSFVFEEDNVTFALHFYDMQGEERFASIISPFYRGSKGVVLCYACDIRRSFERLQEFASLPEQFLPKTIAAKPRFFVLGTRNDKLPHAVGLDEARNLSRQLGATFLGEVSSTTNYHLEDAFLCIAHQVFRKCNTRQQIPQSQSQSQPNLQQNSQNTSNTQQSILL